MEKNIVYGPKVSENTINNTNQTLNDYLMNITKNHLDKILMIDAESEEHITCRNVIEKSYEIHAYLQNLECENDDIVIAIICENRFDYLSVLLAGLNIGAMCACINPLYSSRELVHAFDISQPTIALTSSKTFSKVENVQKNCPFLKHVINLDSIDEVSNNANLTNNNFIMKSQQTDGTKTAIILFSSGTTGLSKGVMLAHKSLIFLMEIYRTEKFIEFPEDNIVCGMLPMCHALGLFCILSCFVLGHTYILMKRYGDISFLNYIEKYRINTLYTVPCITLFLAKDSLIDDYNLSSLKFISNGGGMIRESVEEMLKNRFTLCDIVQNYGMTETTTMCLCSLPSSKSGSTGSLVPGMVAKIVDINDGSTLGPFQNGEFCVKGPLLMKGYVATASKNNTAIDSEGWLHSGDIAYYDDSGNFHVIDRIKEIIKYKGFQVPPSEIEILLMQHPLIESAGVVGVPDEHAGELPRAYVVKKPGSNITEDELKKYVAENLSPPKKLRGGVKFVDQLPKTISGKVERKELKKWVTAGL